MPQLTEAQAQALPLVPPSLIPRSGNFWSVSRPNYPPWPCDPYPGLPVYRLPDGSYLLDDSTISFPPPGPAISASAAARSFLTQASLATPSTSSTQSTVPGIPGLTNSPPPNPPNPPQLLPSGSVPTNGTFWMLAQTNWPPFPYNPCPGCDVYALSDGSYLVDDTSYSWPAPSGGGATPQGGPQPAYSTGDLWLEITGVTNFRANLILHGTTSGTLYTILSRQSLSPNDPWDAEQPLTGADGQDWTPAQIPTFGRSVLFFEALVGSATPQRLWLFPLGISNGCFNLILHGTTDSTSYDILSTVSLHATNNWAVETNFLGTSGQFWTPMSIPLSGRSSLFLSARSWVDSTGSGIPDWWLLQYFGTTDVNPYALCPSGDGWTILQAYQNGWNPTNFYTPPAPTAWAYVTPGGNSRVIQWQADSGPVQGYELVKYHIVYGWSCPGCWEQQSTQFVSAATYSLTDTSIQQPADDPDINPYDGFRDAYLLYALYSGGPSASATVTDATTDLSARLVHGPGGQMQLALLSVPNGTTAISLQLSTNCGCGWGLGVNQTIDIPIGSFTNNLYTFSDQQYPLYAAYLLTVQAITPPGFAGLPRVVETDCQRTIRYPFLDASSVLKDDLIFSLQAQTAAPADPTISPIYLGNPEGVGLAYRSARLVPVYAAASHRARDSSVQPGLGWQTTATPLHPWEVNVTLQNFEYQPTNAPCWTSTSWSGGGSIDSEDYYWFSGGTFFDTAGYASSQTTNGCPSALSAPAGRCFGVPPPVQGWWLEFDPVEPLVDGGNGTCSILSVHPNAYGLPLVSVVCQVWDPATGQLSPPQVFAAGATLPYDYDNVFLDQEGYGVPVVQKELYQFTTGGNLAALLPDAASTNGGLVVSSLLIASVGNPDFTVSAWLRYRLTNGPPGVYGYIEQYFDKAYQVDTNGNVTTTQTGILSPYGYFFPTEPGPAALVTMPNIEDGQRGTGIVNVIKLQLDVNHDGTMDLSFGGPDNTSQARPFVFWINNDNDGTGLGQDVEVMGANMPDYQYGQIRSWRNLEDFARLWVCGLPKLPTSQGYTVTLSMSPASGNPAINLYAAITNSADYLSNTNAAVAQFTQRYLGNQLMFDYSQELGTISSTQTYTLPVNTDGTPQYTNFLFDGAGIGAGQLTLTISQGTNVLAQTSAWLDLHDIKDFYECAVITNVFSGPSTNWSGAIETVQPAVSSALGDDTNLIVLVHGFMVSDWEWINHSETVFKRLYWAGYHGSFATVKWPCQTGSPLLFDLSELDAYKASAGLTTYLNQLRSRFPGYRLNILAHSQGNALVSEAIENQGLQFDTYILTQGAMPASSYDVNAPTNTTLLNAEVGHPTPDWQPMGYHGIYTNLTGSIVNFYNTNDFLLTSGAILGVPVNWEFNQGLKPDSPYGSDGTNVWEYVEGAPNMPITDSEISRAFVARSRTKAVGAQTGLDGVISSSVDLHAQFGFGQALDDHSAQWKWPIQTSRPYYQQVLRSCLIQPAP